MLTEATKREGQDECAVEGQSVGRALEEIVLVHGGNLLRVEGCAKSKEQAAVKKQVRSQPALRRQVAFPAGLTYS